MMGDMTGLDLVQQIKTSGTKTQVILMSAYDTTNLRKQAEELGLSGYISKPFTVPEILEVIQQALPEGEPTPQSKRDVEGFDKDEAINKPLKMLYTKTGAHYVLLLDAEGHPVRVVGRTKPATLARLATFVATSFLAVTELASLLGDNSSVLKSSYYEGNNYNIYAYAVNPDYFLAVVFGTKDKPGTVWFYTKQTATALATILGDPNQNPNNETPTEQIVEQFEDLLGKDAPQP
jgi:YesN/AraC family two-component response regulator